MSDGLSGGRIEALAGRHAVELGIVEESEKRREGVRELKNADGTDEGRQPRRSCRL